MRNTLYSVALCMALLVVPVESFSVSGQDVTNNYSNNRQPLLQKEYIELPLGTIKPKGWMEQQLLLMKMV